MANIFNNAIKWNNLIPRTTNQKLFQAAVYAVILYYMVNYGRHGACQMAANKYKVDYDDLCNMIDGRLDSGLKQLHHNYFKAVEGNYKLLEADESITTELNDYIKAVYRGAMN